MASFTASLRSTISLTMGLSDSAVVISNLFITENRRILLVGISITYTISVISTTDIYTLMSVLNAAVRSGGFASSLSSYSGLSDLTVQGIFVVPSTNPTSSPLATTTVSTAGIQGISMIGILC